jgi:hypothetical protein
MGFDDTIELFGLRVQYCHQCYPHFALVFLIIPVKAPSSQRATGNFYIKIAGSLNLPLEAGKVKDRVLNVSSGLRLYATTGWKT